MKKSFLALLFVLLIIGSFFIYQGFEYQNRFNMKKKKILSDEVIANNKIVSKNGLIKKDGTYYFSGEVYNNYVQIFNRLYRIISISDGYVKIVSNNNEAVFYYGNNNEYMKSNIYSWLNKGDKENTGIYYDSIPGVRKLLVPTKYCVNEYIDSNIRCLKKQEAYFSIMGIDDYIISGESNGFLNNGVASFLLGVSDNKEVLNKEANGSVRRINNGASGIRVVMTLKKKMKVIKGDGTFKRPYVLEQDNNENIINKYVKLDDDLYQVMGERDNVLRLRLTTYLKEKRGFSNKFSGFNPLNKNNIAYYLNNDYYEGLSYKNYLTKCRFFTGELGDSKDYFDIYKSVSSVMVGLPNIFDLNVVNFLTDYYLVNTSSNSSSISFVYDKFGKVLEDRSITLKRIVPVVCLKKELINDRGTGTVKNPYIID